MRDLNKAFIEYTAVKTQESYDQFIGVFVENIRGNGSIYVPITSEGALATVESQGNGDYYIVCTNEDELSLCSSEDTKEINLKEVVDAMMSNPNVKGICINPYNPSPCLISKYYVMALGV